LYFSLAECGSEYGFYLTVRNCGVRLVHQLGNLQRECCRLLVL